MRPLSLVRLCAKLIPAVLGLAVLFESLSRAFHATGRPSWNSRTNRTAHGRRCDGDLAEDSESDLLARFGNEAQLGDVTSTWANLTVLTGDLRRLKDSSLLYRVNTGEVNRTAVYGVSEQWLID